MAASSESACSDKDIHNKQIIHDENTQETNRREKNTNKRKSSPKGAMSWIHTQIENGVNARQILSELIPGITVPEEVDELSLWRGIFEILSEPPPREKLKNFNTLDDVKTLIRSCKKILILTGAGVSVSCGIPDFRSRDGIYARLRKDYPDLPNPTAMFDIQYFRNNPYPFFKFAKEIYPGQFVPSLCHRFIAYLDKSKKLLRNYTQNIDTLEQVAGIENVIQCHGSFASASCMQCKMKVDSDEIKQDIFNQKIPYCRVCTADNVQNNILKPDIVFFGESLPDYFHKQIEQDQEKADLLIVIGSSLKVRPVSLIPDLLKSDVPQILINREPLSHRQFDIELLGNCDDIICELCRQMQDGYEDLIHGFTQNSLPDWAVKTFSESKATTEEHGKNVSFNSRDNSPTEIHTSSSKDIQPNNVDETNAACLPTASVNSENVYYVHVPPSRYIFHGAEVSVTDKNLPSDSESSDVEMEASKQDVNDSESNDTKSEQEETQNNLQNTKDKIVQNEDQC